MIETGLYRHYKGGMYVVLYQAKHSETMEDLVVYQDAIDASKIWARPAEMWNEIVEVDGVKMKRFEKVED